jgi:hypothetical protein
MNLNCEECTLLAVKGILGGTSKKNVDFHKLLLKLALLRFVLVEIELI